MSNPLAAAAAALPLEDPVPAEQPRPGDPGGEPCRYCPVTDEDAIWSNSHWRAVPRAQSPIPGGILLISKLHADTLGDLPEQQQREFGVVAAAIDQAIMNLGEAARVHMYRWGDGCAHFHVHFIPRPLGRPQFGWRNLPFLEDRYPHPGEDHHTAAAKAIGAYLAAGSPRPGNRPAD